MSYTHIYMRFPCILRNKLLKGEIQFPAGTNFNYGKILTYRAVERKKDDCSPVTRMDFRSYFELGRKIRGVSKDYSRDSQYYGVSSFIDRKCVEQLMKFPNPNKKMAVGYVYAKGGPEYTNDKHVCWWLYENADVSNFKIIEE